MSRRFIRRAALVLAAGGAALTVSFGLTAVSYAAYPPHISASSPGPNETIVKGAHFTPGGPVNVYFYDDNYYPTNSYTVTAGKYGRINAGLPVTPCNQYVHVLAQDADSGAYSNWTYAFVYCTT